MNRLGKVLTIGALVVVGLIAFATLAESAEPPPQAPPTRADIDDILARLDRLEGKLFGTASPAECPCGPTCPCGPDCPCPGCPHRAKAGATGGHWNCGPGGCQWIPDRPATQSALPTRPAPAGQGWRWEVGSQGVHTWVRDGMASPEMNPRIPAEIVVPVQPRAFAAPVRSGPVKVPCPTCPGGFRWVYPR